MNRQAFEQAIIGGFERLYALGLPGAPEPDALELAVETWVDTLWSDAAWDDSAPERITAGFRLLARHCERWPLPAQLLHSLPPRPAAASEDAPLSEEEIARNKDRLASILRMLAEKTVIRPEEP